MAGRVASIDNVPEGRDVALYGWVLRQTEFVTRVPVDVMLPDAAAIETSSKNSAERLQPPLVASCWAFYGYWAGSGPPRLSYPAPQPTDPSRLISGTFACSRSAWRLPTVMSPFPAMTTTGIDSSRHEPWARRGRSARSPPLATVDPRRHGSPAQAQLRGKKRDLTATPAPRFYPAAPSQISGDRS